MNKNNLMVTFVAIAMAVFLLATISASSFTIDSVKIDGVLINDATVTAGETISVKVQFHSDVDAKKVTVNAELDDAEDETSEIIMVANKTYKKTLTLEVPYDFDDDELDSELDLEITIDGEDLDGEDLELGSDYERTIPVLKPGYNMDFKSVNVASSISAGETVPVEVVLKNIGYNDLDDLYISVSIPALGVEKTSYAGDIVAIEPEDDDDDETDTFSGRIYLTVPYDVDAGVYTLEVEVSNDDMTLNMVKQVIVKNDFANPVVKAGNDLIIVNPTNSIKAYTVIVESPASVSESVVVVPAGSSKTVTVTPNADGDYEFNVNVLSGSEIVSTISFSGSAEGKSLSNPVIVLTVILAIIFLVLLIVLIVLIGKRPEKAEEFGESYY